MRFTPRVYLSSFTVFVVIFMALGGWAAWGKFTEHFVAQGYLGARVLNSQVVSGAQGPALVWDDTVPLPTGGGVRIRTTAEGVSLAYGTLPMLPLGVPRTAPERVEDVRLDPDQRHLFVRARDAVSLKDRESIWLYKIDLHQRRILKRVAASPHMLPPVYRPR